MRRILVCALIMAHGAYAGRIVPQDSKKVYDYFYDHVKRLVCLSRYKDEMTREQKERHLEEVGNLLTEFSYKHEYIYQGAAQTFPGQEAEWLEYIFISLLRQEEMYSSDLDKPLPSVPSACIQQSAISTRPEQLCGAFFKDIGLPFKYDVLNTSDEESFD